MSPCPTESDWDRYHAGELDEAQAAEVQEHFASCATCAARNAAHEESYRRLVDDLRGLHQDKYANRPPPGDTTAGSSDVTEPPRGRRRPVPVGEASGTPPRDVSVTVHEEAGSFVGPYRLLEMLGQGGFGIVYLAEQTEPIRRRVALKIIKLGMDTRQVVARFEAERQALAMMDHPNVAKVFDAGSTGHGRPYFVMELVQGVPITDYCDRHKLGTRERLELFIQVCDAVQHAHQKGIIHRDIKPSNVLVTVRDERPVPKVIDFGVAKAISHRLTAETIYTEQGMLIGTPAYMSPEQAEMTGLNVDTRTDIYSLGVLLYELLVGTMPFDVKTFREAGFAEIQRIIREEEPPKPSTRLSRLGGESIAVALKRQTDAPTLIGQLRGDLDWIIIRAMDKDRTRRYGAASELAADLRRHLNHEVVLASPPRAAYRVRKFVRRHRLGVAAGAAVATALVLGIVGTTWMAIIARQRGAAETEQRKLAQASAELARQEAARARAVQRFLVEDMLSSVDPSGNAAPDVKVRDVLDAAAQNVGEAFSDQPEVETVVHTTLGAMYDALGLYEKAERELRMAIKLGEGRLGAEHQDMMAAKYYLIDAVGARADPEAITLGTEVLRWRRQHFGPEHPDTLKVMNTLGGICLLCGKSEEGEQLLQETLDLRRRVLGTAHADTCETLWVMGISRIAREDLKQAVEVLREAVDCYQAARGEESLWTFRAQTALAKALSGLGHFHQAVQLLREACTAHERLIGEDSADYLACRVNLAWALIAVGQYEEAEAICRAALPTLRLRLGSDSVPELTARHGIATCLLHNGPPDAAEAEFAELVRILSRIANPYLDLRRVLVLSDVSALRVRQGRPEEAEHEALKAYELARSALGPGHSATSLAREALGHALAASGRHAEAEQNFLAAYGELQSLFGEADPRVQHVLRGLADNYDRWGRTEDAAKWRARLPTTTGAASAGPAGGE